MGCKGSIEMLALLLLLLSACHQEHPVSHGGLGLYMMFKAAYINLSWRHRQRIHSERSVRFPFRLEVVPLLSIVLKTD